MNILDSQNDVGNPPPLNFLHRESRILLCVTCYDGKKYCINKFISAIRILKEHYQGNLDIIFVDNSEKDDYAAYIKTQGFKVIRSKRLENSQETLTEAYNALRAYFLERDYTHLFSVEQDIIVPKIALDKLLEHNKDITSGLYYLGEKPCVMIGKTVQVPPGREREFRFEKSYFKYDFIDEELLKTDKLIEVFCAGLGCMLIKRQVLEKVKFRVDHNGNIYKGHNDMYWSIDCKNKGFKIHLDPTIKCAHLNYF